MRAAEKIADLHETFFRRIREFGVLILDRITRLYYNKSIIFICPGRFTVTQVLSYTAEQPGQRKEF